MNTNQTNHKGESLRKRLNWGMVAFFTITPLVGIIGALLLGLHGMISLPTIFLGIFLICATALTITGGYHRLFSHKSYKAHPIIIFCYAIFGAAAFQGSIIEWASDHRNHHRYTDTTKDPYNINQGFWYAHIGWIFLLRPEKRNLDNVQDLLDNPIVAWQHRNISLLSILAGFVMPMLVACLWGDPLGGLIIAGALRMSLQHHFTWCINSVCHYFGKQTYDDSTARDHWFTAIFTFGEGYHNFHHKFPIDYRNGVRYFHYDPTKWMIRTFKTLGLAENLKRVPQQKIIQYRMRMEKMRMEAKASHSDSLIDQLGHLVEPAYNAVAEALSKIEGLEKAYAEYKAKKDSNSPQQKVDAHIIKRNRRSAQKELHNALVIWGEMLRRCSAMAKASAQPA